MTLTFTRALVALIAVLASATGALAQAPLNDNFADRIVLSSVLPVTDTGTNVNSTTEPGETSYGGKTVWWSWTAPANGVVQIDTNGSNFDTYLSIFRGTELATLSLLAANDDGGIGTNSLVNLTVTQGQTYQIRVDGYSAGVGSIMLNISQGKAITSALTADADSGTPFSYQITTNFTPASYYVYGLPYGLTYNYLTGLISGTVSSYYSGTYYVTLEAYTSPDYSTVSATLLLSVNDHLSRIVSTAYANASQGLPFQFQVTATHNPTTFHADNLPNGLSLDADTGLITGTPTVYGTYYITLSATNDYGAGPGQQFTLSIASAVPGLNDDSVTVARGQVLTYQIGGTRNPTSFAAEDLPPGLLLDPTSGLISGRPTASGFYGSLISATNSYGTGQAYLYISVVDPVSDSFAKRLPLTGNRISRFVSTEGATEEPGEPVHAGQGGGGSVWWTWTAPETAQYQISVDTDAIFAVYQGDTLAHLKEVVSNPDQGEGRPIQLVFEATAGQVYQIALDSIPGETLVTNLRLNKVGTQVARVLQVSTDIGGSVTQGFLGTSFRQLGSQYTIVATPAPGYVFAGWVGSAYSAQRSLTFTMQEGFSLRATFAVNPFTAVRGTYMGLLSSSENTTPNSELGLFRIALNGGGAFTGSLTMSNGTFPFQGRFNYDGSFTGVIRRPHQWPLSVSMSLDLSDPSSPLSVSIGDDTFSTNITASRGSSDTIFNPSPQAGAYTFAITGDAPTHGTGYGRVQISASGAIRFTGVLPDGAPFSSGSFLNDSSSWPLYATAYQGQGSVSGFVSIGDDGYSDFQGSLNWLKPQTGGHSPNADGFVTTASIVGDRYAAPPPGNRPVSVLRELNNLAVEAQLQSIDVETPWSIQQIVTFTANNQVVVRSGAPVTLNVDTARGIFRGTFSYNGFTVPFAGALLQRDNAGYGLFYAGLRRGSLTLSTIDVPDASSSSTSTSSGASSSSGSTSSGSISLGNSGSSSGGVIVTSVGSGGFSISSGGTVINGGTLTIVQNPITTTTGSSVVLTTGNTYTGATTFTGSTGSLIVNSGGTLMLTGNNTYTGGTTISAGTLTIGSNAGVTTTSGASLTLTGMNTYSGSTTISAGPLNLGAIYQATPTGISTSGATLTLTGSAGSAGATESVTTSGSATE